MVLTAILTSSGKWQIQLVYNIPMSPVSSCHTFTVAGAEKNWLMKNSIQKNQEFVDPT